VVIVGVKSRAFIRPAFALSQGDAIVLSPMASSIGVPGQPGFATECQRFGHALRGDDHDRV
jgi:hypothetical protein